MVKKVLIGLLVVIVLLVVFKDFVIKNAITTVGSKVVGTKLEIDKFSYKVLSQKINIEGIKLYNPKGFPEEPLIFIDQIVVNYDLSAILKGKIHCPLVVLDLREMVVVKNKEELLNVDEIPIVKNQSDEEASTVEAKKQEKPADVNMQIDLLRLTVSKVVYKDYSKGGEPTIKAYDVGIKDKEYKDITSPNQLVGLIMVGAMKGTAIKGAKIYGMASLASIVGIGFLPAGVATVLVSKDHSVDEYNYGLETVYNASVALFKEKGTLEKADQEKGTIIGKLEGCNVAIKLEKVSKAKTKITVSARKMLLPKPKVAGGIIYQIFSKLEEK